MLLAECAARGWPARRCEPVADEPDAVASLFANAGAAEDFLVTTGGVSMGDLDLLPAAAEAAGFRLLFHGVAMRPGKPVAFGQRGDCWWIGLPGNPVSASVVFRLLGTEALSRFEGDARPAAPRVRAWLSARLPAAGDRDRFFDADCRNVGTSLRATPMRSSGSHDLAAYGRANALVYSPAGTPALPAGADVDVILLSAAAGVES
jgi:molybdopterin molybdotransferase